MKNNMDQSLQQELNTRYKQLPSTIQKVVADENTKKQLLDIAAKHDLTDDQFWFLKNEVYLVLYNFEYASALVDNVRESLEIDQLKAVSIVKDIDKIIFAPIEQELIDMESKKFDHDDSIQSASQSANAIHEPFYKPQPHQFVPPAAPKPASSQQVGEHHEPLPDMPVEEREAAIKKLFKNNAFDHQLEEQLEGHVGASQNVPLQKQPAPVPKPDIMEARLKGTFSMPKEEVKIQAKQVPGTPSQPSQPAPAQNPAPKYPAKDPYREPLE
jgi:hypothetical protein